MSMLMQEHDRVCAIPRLRKVNQQARERGVKERGGGGGGGGRSINGQGRGRGGGSR